MAFQVMTFQSNGIPTPIENKKWKTRDEANKRMSHLKTVYDKATLFVSERK